VHAIKLITFPMLLTLSLAAGSVAAASPGAPEKSMAQEQTTAGEQLKNVEQEDQLRHRVNENDPENAKKVRDEQGQKQEGKKSQHQYQEQSPGQHMQQSGSGMGGGGGKGR
jgi:Ni/Co efflux regulator RcnB